MKKTRTRLWSLLLTVAMLLTLLPATALAEGEGTEDGTTGITQEDPAQETRGTDPVAQIVGKEGYDTLQEAITDAGNGDTITLLTDAEVTMPDFTEKKTLTFDLAENTLTLTNTDGFSIDNGAEIIFQNGKLVSNDISGNLNTAVIGVTAGSKVTLDRVTYNTNKTGLLARGDAAAVNIYDSEINATGYCFGTNASGAENYDVVITLEDSIFNGSDDGAGTAMYINVPGELYIDNCEIYGYFHGLFVRGGTAEIKNSTIVNNVTSEANADYFDGKSWGTGNTVNLAALTLGNKILSGNNAYNYPTNVTLVNTTITSAGEYADLYPAVYAWANSDPGNGVTVSYDNCTINGAVVYGNDGNNIDATIVNGSVKDDSGNYYFTLADAVAAVVASEDKTGTVTLLKDCSGAGIGLFNDEGANGIDLTIDFGGYTYTCEDPAVGSTGTESQGFHLEKGNTVTLKNGTIVVDKGSKNTKMLIQNYCDLTLEDLTLEGGPVTQYIISSNYGDITAENISIDGSYGPEMVAIDLMHWLNDSYRDKAPTMYLRNTDANTISGSIEVYCYGTGAGTCAEKPQLTISGGYFTADPSDYVADGYGVREVSGGYQVGKPVTVTFVSEGTAVKTENIFAGDTVTAPSVSKEGYVLVSWVDETGDAVDLSQPVVSNLTLTAQWAIKTYTVTYAVDGVEQEKTVSHGAKITYVPEKEGYAFAGWYVDETMTESWDMETDVVTSDITLYAKWNEVVTPDDQPAGVDQIQVAPSTPVIEDSSVPGAEEVIKALEEGVEQEGVTEAAKDLATDSAYMAEIAAVAKAELELGDDENVTLVVETSLNISVTDVKDGDSFTLDITPKYTITATAGDKSKVIVENETLTVTEPVTLTIPLPKSFADAAELFVHHLKNNRTYVYDGEVAGDKLTFTNPHGFSQFTISRTGPEASVDGVQYATLQEAIDAVENRGTVTVHQSGLYAQVSGVKTFWVVTDTGVEMPQLYAAPGYTLSKDGNKYTVRVRTIDDPDNDYELPTWDITVEDSDNGDVEVSPEEAKPTTTITITVTPDKGYAVAEVVVTAENGKEITVTDKGNGKYTFSMPNSDVTIEVTFQPVSGGAAGSDLTITAPTGWVNPFADVAANAWYYDAVGYANANGLMGGTSATTFAPNGAMNRSMVWTVIARLAGQTISGANWAEDAKAWAVAQGVSDGTNPDGNVTREELVTMLYRYIGSPVMNVPELGLINSYPDAASVSDWAQDAFAWALSRGIIDGRDGKLASGESVTRAEAATILARFHLLTK